MKDFDVDGEWLSGIIENEGFDYAFTSYSDFTEIEDKEFHRLRELFLEARAEFVHYLELDGEV